MVWNVYKFYPSANQVKVFNIFSNDRFKTRVRILRKTSISKEAFIKDLERELMCYFWSKYEYEISISELFPTYGYEPLKVDVYSQVMLNWEVFANYVWEAAI